MKKMLVIASSMFILLFVLTACKDEAEKAEQQKKEIKVSDETPELEKETSLMEKYGEVPEIPNSFEEATQYETVGKFAGQPYSVQEEEIQEELDGFPKLPSNALEAEKKEYKKYVLNLFKEDFRLPDITIDQLENMQSEEGENTKAKEHYNVAVLLDSGGPAMKELDGEETKIEHAKKVIDRFAAEFPKQAQVSLYVYGQTADGDEKENAEGCDRVEEVYPLGEYDSTGFAEALTAVHSAGERPVAKAIEKVNEDFADYDANHHNNIIYIVSGGIDTCGGDPVSAIKGLADAPSMPVINLIGYGADGEGEAQLQKMAEVSGAHFVNAQNKSELEEEFKRTSDMGKLWWEWLNHSQDAKTQLMDSYTKQIIEWSASEDEKLVRENQNQLKAFNYLWASGKMDARAASDINGDISRYYLNNADGKTALFNEYSEPSLEENVK